jgi:hypothetical protein
MGMDPPPSSPPLVVCMYVCMYVCMCVVCEFKMTIYSYVVIIVIFFFLKQLHVEHGDLGAGGAVRHGRVWARLV